MPSSYSISYQKNVFILIFLQGNSKTGKQKQIFEGDFYFLLLLKYLYKYIRPKFSGVLLPRNFEVYRFATMNNRNVQVQVRNSETPGVLQKSGIFLPLLTLFADCSGDISRIPSTLFMVVYFGTLLCSFSIIKWTYFWEKIRLGFVY